METKKHHYQESTEFCSTNFFSLEFKNGEKISRHKTLAFRSTPCFGIIKIATPYSTTQTIKMCANKFCANNVCTQNGRPKTIQTL